MSWKLNKKNIAHFVASPATATLHALHRTVGKSVRKRLHLRKRYIFPGFNSAGSYSYARGEYYGPTGSIVGRY